MKNHVVVRNTRTKLVQEYLPGNSLHQSTSHSSDNMQGALHPKSPVRLSPYCGSTTLPSGKRHLDLSQHLRQGQYLEVFPGLYSCVCWRTLALEHPPARHGASDPCNNAPHCTASCLVSCQTNCFVCPGSAWKFATRHPSCGCTRNATLSVMLASGDKKPPSLMNVPVL